MSPEVAGSRLSLFVEMLKVVNDLDDYIATKIDFNQLEKYKNYVNKAIEYLASLNTQLEDSNNISAGEKEVLNNELDNILESLNGLIISIDENDPKEEITDILKEISAQLIHAYKVYTTSVNTKDTLTENIHSDIDIIAPCKGALNLSDNDFREVAKSLKIEEALVRALAEVESAGCGFLKDGRPKIRFESHVFSKYTNHKYDNSNPNISTINWKPYLCQKGDLEYKRLEEAYNIDAKAALKSCSWGLFQLMGFNYQKCSFSSVEEFVKAMCSSPRDHLDAVVEFIKNSNLGHYLVHKRWKKFAHGYNGSEYWKNSYDRKLEHAYIKWRERLSLS